MKVKSCHPTQQQYYYNPKFAFTGDSTFLFVVGTTQLTGSCFSQFLVDCLEQRTEPLCNPVELTHLMIHTGAQSGQPHGRLTPHALLSLELTEAISSAPLSAQLILPAPSGCVLWKVSMVGSAQKTPAKSPYRLVYPVPYRVAAKVAGKPNLQFIFEGGCDGGKNLPATSALYRVVHAWTCDMAFQTTKFPACCYRM